jgi:hypothetical protein
MTPATIDAARTTSFSPEIQTPADVQSRPCPNCATSAIGEFCHRCGSRADVPRLTLRALGGELLAQFVELDHGVLHTIVRLLRSPGETIRGYNAGRRRGLTSPLNFIALSAALSLLLSGALPQYKAARDEQFKSLDTYHMIYTPAQFELFSKVERTATSNATIIIIALLIPVSLALRFVFRKKGLNLAETGAMVCYMYGLTTFVALAIAVPIALTGQSHLESTIGMIMSLAFIIHVSFGMFGRSFSTAWRALWGNLLGLLLMQAVLIVIPYVFAR